MFEPIDTHLPTVKGTIYTVPDGVVFTLSTIHISNENAGAQTFTIYCRTSSGTSRAISVIDQAIVAKGVAIYADPIRLTEGSVIEGVASAGDLSIFITGKETVISIDARQ
jgi:hypothetical protein